jgi:hypothetical protein
MQQNTQTNVFAAGFEPATSTSERLQVYVLDRTTTRAGLLRRVRIVVKSDYYLHYVILPQHFSPFAWNNLAVAERIFMKFDI